MQESSAARLPQLSYGKAVFFEGSFMGVKLAIRIISYVQYSTIMCVTGVCCVTCVTTYGDHLPRVQKITIRIQYHTYTYICMYIMQTWAGSRITTQHVKFS